MRKIILITMATIFAVGVMAQQKIRVWKNNSIAYEEEVTQIDSITFYNEYEGALNGEFSVSPTKKVRFSKGNLQYQASTDTWRFADNQYECIGNANTNISSTYNGWIDLFGWGTGNNPTLHSTDDNDYLTFVDWGTNAISNGGNVANEWRSLTKDECVYLLYSRTNATSLFGAGTVNGVHGVIILPDNWVTPDGLTFNIGVENGMVDNGELYLNSNWNNYDHNVYTEAQWTIMESAGAVFLAATGNRQGTTIYNIGQYGFCWTSSFENVDNRAYYIGFGWQSFDPRGTGNPFEGFFVRLIQEEK